MKSELTACLSSHVQPASTRTLSLLDITEDTPSYWLSSGCVALSAALFSALCGVSTAHCSTLEQNLLLPCYDIGDSLNLHNNEEILIFLKTTNTPDEVCEDIPLHHSTPPPSSVCHSQYSQRSGDAPATTPAAPWDLHRPGLYLLLHHLKNRCASKWNINYQSVDRCRTDTTCHATKKTSCFCFTALSPLLVKQTFQQNQNRSMFKYGAGCKDL